MYKVSLLPSEYRLYTRTAQRKDWTLLIASVAMIVLFMVYFVLSANTLKKDNELNNIKLQSEALDQAINHYLQVEKLNDDVNTLLEKALAAYGTNPAWHEIISYIGNSVPNSIGLTSLNMIVRQGAGECTVQGATPDIESLTSWIERLGSIPGVGEVSYNFSSKIEENNPGDVQFDLSMTLLQGSGYQIRMKEDSNE